MRDIFKVVLAIAFAVSAFLFGFYFGQKEAHGADTEITANVGYHVWTQSGHTFRHSDVDDKEFNGWAGKVEITHWYWNWVGIYGFIGMDDDVKQEIFPGKDYEADIWYAGIGLKARKSLSKSLKGYIGYGINFIELDNTYAGKHIEKWTWYEEPGHDFLLGLNYYFIPNWFLNFQAQYTLNKKCSDVWGRTSFHPDGLRMWTGLGYSF